jgi:hypothetical protein
VPQYQKTTTPNQDFRCGTFLSGEVGVSEIGTRSFSYRVSFDSSRLINAPQPAALDARGDSRSDPSRLDFPEH